MVVRREERAISPRPVPVLTPLLVFFGLILLKVWAVRWFALGAANPVAALLLDGGIVLLALALAAMAFPRGRLWAYWGVDVLATLLLVATAVYVAQFEQVPTADTLALAGQLGTVADSVWALLRPAYLLFALDVVGLAVVLALTARNRTRVPARFDRRLVAVATVGAVWSGAVVIALLAAGPIADSVAGASHKGLIAYELVGGGIADAAEREGTAAQQDGDDPEPVDYADPASVQREIDRLLGAREATRVAGAPEPGAFAGKNVLLIQAEALQSFVVGAEVGGEEVTPNLNDLVAESWFAPVTMTQIGKGNTSDAEFVANTSLLTRRQVPASVAWETKAVPSLARTLNDQGYDTQTMHANVVTYWNRDQLYPMLGFDRYRDAGFFGADDVLGMGASDKVFFRKALPKLEALDEAGTPFYAHLVELSAHHPFKKVSTRSDLQLPGALEDTTLGRYLRAQNYADEQLGAAIQRLKDDGLWEDTVVVVYGDHFGLTLSELSADELAYLKDATGRDYTVAEHFRVPLIVHVPGQTKGARLAGTYGQIDIMPTVAELLGIDMSERVHFGRSVFVGGSPVQPIRYYAPEGTFATDELFFRPGMGYDDATVRLMDGADAPRDRVTKAQYEKALALLAVNEAYLAALPERSASPTGTP